MGDAIKHRVRFADLALSHRRFASVFLANAVLVFTLSVTGWSSNLPVRLSQQNKKKVEKHKTLLKLPLEVTASRVGEKPIKLGEEFDGDVDWLKKLKVTVNNKSDKTITWASITFRFPDTRLSGPVITVDYFVGQRSDVKTDNVPLKLEAGQEIEFSPDLHFDALRQSIEKRGSLDEVNHVDIEVLEVMFDDGTLYSGDAIWKRNPDSGSAHPWLKIRDYTTRP